MSKPNFAIRLFSAIWTAVDGLRKVLHLVLLLFVFLVFFGAMSATGPIMPSNAVLEIRPSGFLVEQLEGDPYDRAIQELLDEAPPQTVVQDIVDALDYAGLDNRIAGVHLDLSTFAGGGLSKLQRIGRALREFRNTGKRVIASGDFFSQAGYYIAAQADEVYLHPEGLVFLQGYGRFRTYFKDAIDLLRIDWNIFRVGTHKSFVEPYMRMDMSDEDREATTDLTGQLWQMYRDDVVAARQLEDGAIDDLVDNFLEYVEGADGDLARTALEHGLVDELLTRTEIRSRLIEISGANPDYPDQHNAADMPAYLGLMRMLDSSGVKAKNVAVVVAAGDIRYGSQSPGTIGAESTSWLLRRALHDDAVEAVVLRIDSPGGSAFASDVIANEVAALQAAGKPVVASMSSVAASGGYWIAAGADSIIASPSTITGSIGIFGMLPTYQRSLDAVGVAVDGVGSTIWSGELRPDREMSDAAKRLFQLVIEDGYDDFISRVATSRSMSEASVDNIAQGRVWTGVDALGHGLVDDLGDIEDAIAAAAEFAGLAGGTYGVVHIEPELSPTEQLIVDLLGTARRAGLALPGFVSAPGPIETLASRIEKMMRPMLYFDDPKGVYAHCLCRFE